MYCKDVSNEITPCNPCDGGNEMYPMPITSRFSRHDNTWYIKCINGTPLYLQCPDDKIFSESQQSCITCDQENFEPISKDCTEYQICHNVLSDVLIERVISQCSNGEVFNKELQKCVEPHENFVCNTEDLL